MTRRAWFCLFAAGILSRLPWTRPASRWVDRLLQAAERDQ